MNNCLPRDITTDAEGGKTEPATGTPTVRRLIVLMLLSAATLDLTRCGLVMAGGRAPAPPPPRGGRPAPAPAPRPGHGRAGRSRTDRSDRARLPGRPALGRLGSIAHRPRIGPAGGRVRLPQPLPDSRRGHRCPGNTAGRHRPGDRGPGGPPGHDTGNPPGQEAMTSNEGRSAAISSSAH